MKTKKNKRANKKSEKHKIRIRRRNKTNVLRTSPPTRVSRTE